MPVQGHQVGFRANEKLVTALAEQAQRVGCSVSEYLRSIVREKLRDPAPSLHGRAADGDGDAQAELAELHYQQARNGSEAAILALDRAVTYARLAFCRRGTRHDAISLIDALDQHAAALAQAGYPLAADRAQGEAIAVSEYASDYGDEGIGNLVVAAGANLSPGALNLARQLRETVDGMMGC